ncbi:MAG TPA: peptidoglycan-associated lipoprotein Pal [Candidatus Deferrimicrobiaceae bacterium]
MKNGLSWQRLVLSLLLAAVLAAGCAKQQTVKSGETSGEAAPSAAPAPGGEPKEAIRETPVTEAPAGSAVLAAKAAEAGVAVTEEKPSRFADVLFDFDKADLTEEGKKACQAVAEYLRKNPRAKVTVEGHCDERGSAEYNLALGERRAVAVKNYLVSLGVPKGAITTVSFGKERPLDPGHTEAAWAKNRRAHFVLK